jgi:hypothetical protein
MSSCKYSLNYVKLWYIVDGFLASLLKVAPHAFVISNVNVFAMVVLRGSSSPSIERCNQATNLSLYLLTCTNLTIQVGLKLGH